MNEGQSEPALALAERSLRIAVGKLDLDRAEAAASEVFYWFPQSAFVQLNRDAESGRCGFIAERTVTVDDMDPLVYMHQAAHVAIRARDGSSVAEPIHDENFMFYYEAVLSKYRFERDVSLTHLNDVAIESVDIITSLAKNPTLVSALLTACKAGLWIKPDRHNGTSTAYQLRDGVGESLSGFVQVATKSEKVTSAGITRGINGITTKCVGVSDFGKAVRPLARWRDDQLRELAPTFPTFDFKALLLAQGADRSAGMSAAV